MGFFSKGVLLLNETTTTSKLICKSIIFLVPFLHCHNVAVANLHSSNRGFFFLHVFVIGREIIECSFSKRMSKYMYLQAHVQNLIGLTLVAKYLKMWQRVDLRVDVRGVIDNDTRFLFFVVDDPISTEEWGFPISMLVSNVAILT